MRQLGTERIVPMGRHRVRTDLGRGFGATDVVAERGAEGIEKVRELTGAHGSQAVIEAVGPMPDYQQAVGVVRPRWREGYREIDERTASKVLIKPQ